MSDLLRGARLLGRGAQLVDVLVDNGVIQGVGQVGTLDGSNIIDLGGLILMPGAIDSHVHPIHDETFASVSRIAVLGGVTTICNQLYPGPSEGFDEAIDRMRRESEGGVADFAAHLRWDPSRTVDDLRVGAEHGAISVKVFLAHPDKTIQASLGDLAHALTQARGAGLLTLIHAELGDVVDEMLALGHVSNSSVPDLQRWRSTTVEGLAIRAASYLAREIGAPLYVVHASCEEALRACLDGRLAGTTIHVETCPHYVFLDTDGLDDNGRSLVLPPVRPPSDRAALQRAVADGTVDTMGSDHCGHGAAAKPPSVAKAKAGLPGLEAMLPLLLDATLAPDAWLSEQRLLDVLCRNPARIFGLRAKGDIRPGLSADLVAIDPTGHTTLTAEHLHDAAGYTPYEGRQLTGAIEQVWARGELVCRQGDLLVDGGGQFLRSRPERRG